MASQRQRAMTAVAVIVVSTCRHWGAAPGQKPPIKRVARAPTAGSRFATSKQLPAIKYPALNIKMKALVLILCFAVAATVAKPPIGGDDCSDCVNHCKTVKKVKYVEEYDQKCHNEHK